MDENAIETIVQEIAKSAEALSKTDNIDERNVISETIKNLSDTVMAFSSISQSMMDYDFDDEFMFDDDED